MWHQVDGSLAKYWKSTHTVDQFDYPYGTIELN
jgi:hypothetical protein